jgi:hypothetical protein
MIRVRSAIVNPKAAMSEEAIRSPIPVLVGWRDNRHR